MISRVGVLLAFVWVFGNAHQAQPPVFRADAEAVIVSASVKQGNTPVSGLTKTDFRVYDNDVLQEIIAVSLDTVPVDVSIVVDTSTSAFRDMATARTAIREMSSFLRASDRVRVLSMGNSVISAIGWQSAPISDLSAIERIQFWPGNISLVADGVLVGLYHRTTAERRHLVVAVTDGQDSCSIVSGESLRRAAERSGAVLHWIDMRLERGSEKEMPATNAVLSYCRWADRPVDMRSALADGVRSTGGGIHTAYYAADLVAVKAFKAILDDFRSSYILNYVPTGVEPSGWHRLRVEMRSRGYTVRARPGYWGNGPSMPSR